ncbi:hypothetical protein GCM10025857_20490 [Alicyclobacillus contaminans]|uniref:putative bifunctional diguanylate cyclase/phosphodiesterase n=1 Tax=Alicyclobacillus contaminans TaxID=392016 RepID=UPI0003FB4C09|nr:EAL domain-containing protein [Alicyclobacillus contaminans]GMA50692.1 hypothetical protein GCM10025857_20490 [Alicyclobacillus contaminans]
MGDTLQVLELICHSCGKYRSPRCATCPVEQHRQQEMVRAVAGIGQERLPHLPRNVYRALFQHSPFGFVVTDASGVVRLVNPTFTRVTGYSSDEILGKTMKVVQSGKHSKAFYQQMWAQIQSEGYWEGEIWNRTKSGNLYPQWLIIKAYREDDSLYYFGYFADITEQKAFEASLVEKAKMDSLTGLMNRVAFEERLRSLMQSENARGAVLFLDLDGFKRINDSFGHQTGDLLLRKAAKRIRKAVGHSDAVCRVGGDEFLILLADVKHPGEVERMAKRVLQGFERPFVILGRELLLSASIGISTFPDDGENPEVLVRCADNAMYQAKAMEGNTYQFHSGPSSVRLGSLEYELQSAIESGSFELHFQPHYHLESSELAGLEALVRWRHPRKGLVLPGEFIPIAEGTGLIVPLGEWVLREVCAQIARWRQRGLHVPPVSVNLSPVQFQHWNLVSMVTDALEQAELDGNAIRLEITETTLVEDAERAVQSLEALRALGIEVAIDDFGAGYCSLSYLSKLPVDVLKIDKSFVSDVVVNERNRIIVQTIVDMSRALGIRVVAEGVEQEAQRDWLREIRCDFGQGFLFAKPLPIDQVEPLLKPECLV